MTNWFEIHNYRRKRKLPLLGHGSGAYAGTMLVGLERPEYKSYKHVLVQSCNVRRPYASASSAHFRNLSNNTYLGKSSKKIELNIVEISELFGLLFNQNQFSLFRVPKTIFKL